MSEAIKCFYSAAFWVKIIFLVLALAYTFTFHRRVVKSDETGIMAYSNKLAAIVSVLLWSGVGVGGRWIGFQ